DRRATHHRVVDVEERGRTTVSWHGQRGLDLCRCPAGGTDNHPWWADRPAVGAHSRALRHVGHLLRDVRHGSAASVTAGGYTEREAPGKRAGRLARRVPGC